MNISPIKVEPLAVSVSFGPEGMLVVGLADGREISVPVVWFPKLAEASPEDLAEYSFIGGGIGIHWPRVDEDLSVAGLLRSN